jgi:glycerol-3-phosphate acyltransferase PlsY
VYYRFKGGGGLSAAIGGLVVVDWLALVVTPPAGLIIGMGLFRDAYMGSTLWLFLLIPWLWIRTHDWNYVFYAVAMALSFLLATLPLTKQYLRIRKKGPEALRSFYEKFHMGRGLLKIGRLFGLYKK